MNKKGIWVKQLMTTPLTRDERKELYQTAKSLLEGKATLRQGYESCKNISLDFEDCKTAKTRASGLIVHFATKVVIYGDYSNRLDSREFDKILDRRRVTYGHILIYDEVQLSKRRVRRDKVFVALELDGHVDTHCHSHANSRKVLLNLRKRLKKRNGA